MFSLRFVIKDYINISNEKGFERMEKLGSLVKNVVPKLSKIRHRQEVIHLAGIFSSNAILIWFSMDRSEMDI